MNRMSPLLATSSQVGVQRLPSTSSRFHVHPVVNSPLLHCHGRMQHPSPQPAECNSRASIRSSATASDSAAEAAAVPSSSMAEEQGAIQHPDTASPSTSGQQQTVDVPGVSREVVAQKTMAAVKAFSSSKRKVRPISTAPGSATPFIGGNRSTFHPGCTGMHPANACACTHAHAVHTSQQNTSSMRYIIQPKEWLPRAACTAARAHSLARPRGTHAGWRVAAAGRLPEGDVDDARGRRLGAAP